MPRRTTEEIKAAIDEADELLRIFDDYLQTQVAMDGGGPEDPLPSKDEWISRLRAHGVSWSQILQSFEQTLNEFLAVFAMSGPDVEALGRGFQAYFRERTGKELFSVVTPPLRKLKAIAKRGRIRNETEHYLVKEFTDNISDDPGLVELAKTLEGCMANYHDDQV